MGTAAALALRPASTLRTVATLALWTCLITRRAIALSLTLALRARTTIARRTVAGRAVAA